MSPLQAKTFYAAECDRCSETPEDWDGITHWGDQEQALQVVSESEGAVLNQTGLPLFVLCSACLLHYVRSLPQDDEDEHQWTEVLERIQNGDEPRTSHARAWAAAPKDAT